jgi:hypothetical protein
MKQLTTDWQGKTQRVSFCAAAGASEGDVRQQIEIAGKILVPDQDTAYVEFFLSHTLPVVNLYRSAILPQVVANSYGSLMNKVFNLGHLMRSYSKDEKIPRDRILGTVVAVEFVDGEGAAVTEVPPADGWIMPAEREKAYGIRAVAVMHKAAEGVMDILYSWFAGVQPYGGPWTVSLENHFYEEDCGFLLKTGDAAIIPGLELEEVEQPEYLQAAGWTYVPMASATEELVNCLNQPADDERDGMASARICRNFRGLETVLLLGGLDGKIRYRGVGLTPAAGARETEARVRTMMASEPLMDVGEMIKPLMEFGGEMFKQQ